MKKNLFKKEIKIEWIKGKNNDAYFLSNQHGKTVQKDGGESDARDLASELFMAGKTPEENENAIKDSSLNASLESLEHDHKQQKHHDR